MSSAENNICMWCLQGPQGQIAIIVIIIVIKVILVIIVIIVMIVIVVIVVIVIIGVCKDHKDKSIEHMSSTIYVFRDFKDTVYPFSQSDTLFLECVFALFLVV